MVINLVAAGMQAFIVLTVLAKKDGSTSAFVCPQRATCFMRCATCIDKPFAMTVLSVTNVSSDEAAAVRVAIECTARGGQLGVTCGGTAASL